MPKPLESLADLPCYGPPLGGSPAKTKGKRKATPTKPLEKDIENAIREAFRLKYRILLFKTDSGGSGWRSGGSEPLCGGSGLPDGFPDLLGLLPPSGRAVVIEVKRPGNKPTSAQYHYLALLRSQGALALWADSVDSVVGQFAALKAGAPMPPAFAKYILPQAEQGKGALTQRGGGSDGGNDS